MSPEPFHPDVTLTLDLEDVRSPYHISAQTAAGCEWLTTLCLSESQRVIAYREAHRYVLAAVGIGLHVRVT